MLFDSNRQRDESLINLDCRLTTVIFRNRCGRDDSDNFRTLELAFRGQRLLNIFYKDTWWPSRIADFHVYSTTPDSLLKQGADSWQCTSTNKNLDVEQAREVALDLERQGHLIRIVPDELCMSYKWRLP